MKVLFLTQWYPHRYDNMAGLFVRNHAEAVARQGIDVCVLYCHPDSSTEIVDQTTNGVREIYLYHTCHPLKALLRGRNEVLARWGRPDLCQVNVLNKNTFLAYGLYLRWNIPYVVVEHWTGYLPANGDYLRNNSPLQRRLYEFVARKAKCILPVSDMLRQAMQACGIRNNRWQVLNNVVQDSFYKPVSRPLNTSKQPEGKPFELLHVSCFNEKAKNVRGILNAVKRLETRRQDFTLTLIGTGQDFDAVTAYAQELGLSPQRVRFVGEKAPDEVGLAMRQSDLFILFSRFENAPVVLSECLAVGLPVVSSRVGGIHEMIPHEAGILIPSEDENALLEAIDSMLNHLQNYHPETIRTYGEKYSYPAVGADLKALYESVLS